MGIRNDNRYSSKSVKEIEELRTKTESKIDKLMDDLAATHKDIADEKNIDTKMSKTHIIKQAKVSIMNYVNNIAEMERELTLKEHFPEVEQEQVEQDDNFDKIKRAIKHERNNIVGKLEEMKRQLAEMRDNQKIIECTDDDDDICNYFDWPRDYIDKLIKKIKEGQI